MNRRQLSQRCRIEAVASLDNLFLAAEKARRGKARRPDVEVWWLRRESELMAQREELLSGSYEPGAYRFFEVREPKRRFERRRELDRGRDFRRLTRTVFAWYQFSREGNTAGLRQAYARPLARFPLHTDDVPTTR